MITSALLAGNAAIVLFGVISGRSTLTSCAAASCFSTMTCVTRRSPLPCPTVPPWVLASASGTIFTTPSASTAANPDSRSADSSVG